MFHHMVLLARTIQLSVAKWPKAFTSTQGKYKDKWLFYATPRNGNTAEPCEKLEKHLGSNFCFNNWSLSPTSVLILMDLLYSFLFLGNWFFFWRTLRLLCGADSSGAEIEIGQTRALALILLFSGQNAQTVVDSEEAVLRGVGIVDGRKANL